MQMLGFSRGGGGGAGVLPLLPSLADPLGCLTEYMRLGPQELPSSFSFLTRGLCSERLGDCSGRHSVFRARWSSSDSFGPSSLEPAPSPPAGKKVSCFVLSGGPLRRGLLGQFQG